MDKDFLLSSKTAQHLYHDYAAKMPIIDYHCHVNPQEIAEDKKFLNITQIWLYADHYKWRQMRANGIDERYITGNASDYEKFVMWAKTLERAIGNPLYHWSHLELQRYFDYHGHLCERTADEVWEHCNNKIKSTNMSARSIIAQSNVELICTTDDPIDNLEYHCAIKEDKSFNTRVLPTFRPEKAMLICGDTYFDYLGKLEDISGVAINSFKTLISALEKRVEHFATVGCVVSDHSLDYVMYELATDDEIEAIFTKRLSNIPITDKERLQFCTAFMLEMGKIYAEKNWVMQLHYGCKRNNNTKMFEKLGPDTGFDCISNHTPSAQLADFLDALNSNGNLPRTIIYSLNPADDAYIDTIIGCFNDSSVCGKIQHGSGWWFNDTKTGMINQMTSLANLGLLGNFIGMLTDSRSFLSYTRHEYFRRILCELIGNFVLNGEYPNDETALETIIKGISYNNTKNYFQF